MNIIRQGKQADIGLLLEGTFPFVSGGVSSWVNQIIRGFPELRFAICFLGSRVADYGDMRYELPENVVHLEAHYLHDKRSVPLAAARGGNKKVFSDLRRLHQNYRDPLQGSASGQLDVLMRHRAEGRYQDADLLYSREAWAFITEQYQSSCTDPSFIDYFWTIRVMHAPLGCLMDISRHFIPCRAYHSISTGYAGFLGAMLKRASGRPLLLTEHGIYTKERKIDLFQAQWIRDSRSPLDRNATEVAYFRQLWIRFFEALGRECYHNADSIVALYEANRQRQIADGAPAERTCCIPNGVNLSQLAGLRELRAPGVPPVACLMGRVVPIKDVKTFIRALASASRQLPDLQGWIVGPEDEDQAYAHECRHLVNSLGMDDRISFLGFQKIDRILPKVGVLVLSSISEALPLVILEGFAAGVPCVATDVGSCRQLIEGGEGEDRELGAAGSVVGIADPEALAGAITLLLKDEKRWRQAQRAGLARVQKYYTQDMMLGSYRRLYERTLASGSPASDRPTQTASRRWLWRA